MSQRGALGRVLGPRIPKGAVGNYPRGARRPPYPAVGPWGCTPARRGHFPQLGGARGRKASAYPSYPAGPGVRSAPECGSAPGWRSPAPAPIARAADQRGRGGQVGAGSLGRGRQGRWPATPRPHARSHAEPRPREEDRGTGRPRPQDPRAPSRWAGGARSGSPALGAKPRPARPRLGGQGSASGAPSERQRGRGVGRDEDLEGSPVRTPAMKLHVTRGLLGQPTQPTSAPWSGWASPTGERKHVDGLLFCFLPAWSPGAPCIYPNTRARLCCGGH